MTLIAAGLIRAGLTRAGLTRAGLLPLIVLVAGGCGDSGTRAAPTTSAAPLAAQLSSTAAPSASASASSSVRTTPSYRGKLALKKATITLPDAGVDSAWQADDGLSASGELEIELHLDAANQISGLASGSLGKMQIVGDVDGEKVTASLRSTDDRGFRGTLVGTIGKGKVEALVHLASTDSAIVREGKGALTLD